MNDALVAHEIGLLTKMSPLPPVPLSVVCSVTLVPALSAASMVAASVELMVRSFGSRSQEPPRPASMRPPICTV